MHKTTKIVLAGLACIALAVTCWYCINRVSELNSDASVVEACLKDPEMKGCPSPITQGQADAMHSAADSWGMLGWCAGLCLVFGAAGGFWRLVIDDNDDDRNDFVPFSG